MPRTGARAVWSIFTTTMLWGVSAGAADTIEPFDPGLSDVELYAGFEGLGLRRAEQGAFAEGVLGYGITPAMSMYLAPSFAADGYLTGVGPGFELGAFGTPVNTHHLDLDVGLGVATDGEVLAYAPYLELNLDLEPDLELAGLYVRGGLDVFGVVDDAGEPATEWGTNGSAGAYVTLAERHQVLVELDATWVADPEPDTPHTEVGGLHVGYNVQVLDHLELINEVSADVPQTGEAWSFGFFVGFIACVAPTTQ